MYVSVCKYIRMYLNVCVYVCMHLSICHTKVYVRAIESIPHKYTRLKIEFRESKGRKASVSVRFMSLDRKHDSMDNVEYQKCGKTRVYIIHNT